MTHLSKEVCKYAHEMDGEEYQKGHSNNNNNNINNNNNNTVSERQHILVLAQQPRMGFERVKITEKRLLWQTYVIAIKKHEKCLRGYF